MKRYRPHHTDAYLREVETDVVTVEDDRVALNRADFWARGAGCGASERTGRRGLFEPSVKRRTTGPYTSNIRAVIAVRGAGTLPLDFAAVVVCFYKST